MTLTSRRPVTSTPLARGAGGAHRVNPCGAFAWPAIPGRFGPPWFPPLVGTYSRIKDRFQ